ncbi:MAG: TldD/PmbA family protein [Candidatus Melainabacteria bacterium]|nr:TldD/PmbA family protein [Candidatus Melainabacteria bacterium]
MSTMNTQKLESLASFVVSEAKRLGATDCDVAISESESVSCGVRLAEVEELTGAQDRSLRFRALVGKNAAVTSTTDFRRGSLTKMVRATIAMAKASEPDEFVGMPEAHQFAKTFPALNLYDEAITKVDVNTKIGLAMKAEAAARGADPRITNSEGGSFSDSRGSVVLANSRGFIGSYSATSCSIGAGIVASEDGSAMQTGSWSNSSRTLAGLESPESIGVEAARRAIRHLGARKVKSQEVPVVFDPLMAARLLGQFVGAMDASHVYRGSSFLAGKVGEVVAVPELVIIDDGMIPGALGSHPFDGEGLPTTRRVLLKDGKLQCYLIDSYSGRKLGMEPNSGSTSNLFIEAGKHTQEEIIASVKDGLYLTSVSGPGFNAVSGDYSMGASGIWIENGQLAYPVDEITVAGNVMEMFQNIEMIGSDLVFRSRTCSPTLKIGKMMVAGS